MALEDDRITAFRRGSLADRAARRHLVFAGAQILEPELLARIPEGPGDLVTVLYEPLLAEGAPLATVVTERLWHDLGTPRRYLDGVLDWTFRGSRQASRIVKGAEVDPSATLRRTIVEAGAQVEAEADLRRCVVTPGGKIGRRDPPEPLHRRTWRYDRRWHPRRKRPSSPRPEHWRDHSDEDHTMMPRARFSFTGLFVALAAIVATGAPAPAAHRTRWSQASRDWSSRSSARMSRCAASR